MATPRNVEAVYPLSPSQEGMLFHTLFAESSRVYFEQLTLTLAGTLDVETFRRAWQHVVDRHPILRTLFVWEKQKQPVQVVRGASPLEWSVVDWRGGTADEARLQAFLAEDRERGFEPSKAPPLRVTLVRVDDATQHVVWSFHHLLLDGWSTALVLREVFESYAAYRRGAEPGLRPARPFREYVEWLRARNAAAGEAFWRRYLDGLSGPTPSPRGAGGGSGHGEATLDLSEALTSGLQSLARQRHVTSSTLVQAAWALLLARHAGENDVVFGAAFSGRPAELGGVESMVGMFLGTLPVRARLDPAAPFSSWLVELQAAQVELQEQQHTPLVDVQSWSGVPRGVALFDSLVVFENYPIERGGDGWPAEVRIAGVAFWAHTNYPLHLRVAQGSRLGLSLTHDRARVGDSLARELLRQLEGVFAQVVERPDVPLDAVSLVTPSARAVLADPTLPLVAEDLEPVARRIARWSRETPGAVALTHGTQQLTYAELEARTVRIARRLIAAGLRAGDVVALEGGPRFDLVPALLATFRAGGAALLLDPNIPLERLKLMCREASARHLVPAEGSVVDWRRELPGVGVLDASDAVASDAPLPDVQGADAAYVFFTSGTTGTPKAVLGTHRGLSHFVGWQSSTFGIAPGDRSSHLTGLSFDVVLREILLPLTSGATLCVPDTDDLGADRVLPWLASAGITVLHTVPTLAQAWLGSPGGVALPSLRRVFFAGEPLPGPLVREWRERFACDAQIVNLYGPTETTLAKCWHVVADPPEDGIQPVGRPLPQAQALVLAESGRQCGIGETGEIAIRTPYRTRGYVNVPEENERRFVPNPFSADPDDRLYRTGDRGRLRLDGVLEILGRVDDQVKVRGVRVEPAEIQAVLLRHPAIRQGAVVARADATGQKRLVAYLVAEGVAPTFDSLRAHVGRELPEFMIPSAFVFLEALPVTPNGKLDRRALPEPAAEVAELWVAPRGPIEESLATIWREVLRVGLVGAHDDFFRLGGHSLFATQVVSRVRDAFRIELPIRRLYEAPTLAGLAAAVEAALKGSAATAGAIQPVARDRALPLSFAQRRMWFLDQMAPGGTAYNISFAVRLGGALHEAALEAALERIVARHESLRTTFVLEGGVPVQVIADEVRFPFTREDLSGLGPEARERRVGKAVDAEAATPFDLARGPLVRGQLLRLGPQEHVLLVSLHHIVSDAWSRWLFQKELVAHYTAFRDGRPSPLPPLRIQYADFAAWQQRTFEGERLERQLAYWRTALGSEPARVELATDHPRLGAEPRGRVAFVEFPPDVVEGLRAFCRREGATLFMGLLAAFKSLLARQTGQTDVVVGSPIANRNRSEIEGLIGFFVNTLALRTDLSGDPTFRETVARLKTVTLGAYEHQDVPFERLVQELRLDREADRNPLFDVAFAHQNVPSEAIDLPGLVVAALPREAVATRFDLEFYVTEVHDRLAGVLCYRADLFDPETVQAFAERYVTLLRAAVAKPEMRLSSLPLMDAATRSSVVASSQGPRPSVAETPVPVLVAQRAAQNPDALAVADAGTRVTFGELERRAGAIARRLQDLGVGRGEVVAVFAERSADFVVAALGIVKAGAAYLPLDPGHPADRGAFMLADAGVRVVLVQERLAPGLPSTDAQVVGIAEASKGDGAFTPVAVTPDDLAYVIYTSGSTGRPKGVEVEHRGLANLVAWHRRAYTTGPQDRTTLVASPAFDASVWEVWPSLAGGASLHVPDEETRMTPSRLTAWLRAERVTQSFLPTPLAEAVLREESLDGLALQVLLTGGDKLHRTREGLPFRLVNHYGPTENAVVATAGEVLGGAGDPPIGVAIDHTEAYVLDARMELVPAGVPGELYVGGRSLARGYRGRPDWTAERFVPDPFATTPGARLYRTGDVVRRRLDGALEFLGRNDAQVKVRGHRIELGEVEAALLRHPSVREAAVIAREDALVGFVVLRGDDGEALRTQLRASLPDYMIPRLVALDALPLGSTGKVDRQALQRQALPAEASGDVAVRGPIEEGLAAILAAILERESVGRHDDFFALGGHSLLATRAVSRIRTTFGVELPLRAFFEAPTVAGIAQALEAERGQLAGSAPLVRRADPTETPLSFAQGRLWFLDQLGAGAAYNIPVTLRLSGSLDAGALEASLVDVAGRHDVLRASFPAVDGQPTLRIAPTADVPFEVRDLATIAPAEREAEARRLAGEAAFTPFDLGRGPLMRATLLRLAADDAVLCLTLHHIVADGWSLGVLVRELGEAYAARVAGRAPEWRALPIQYPDFAAWQRDWLQGETLERQLGYWRERLAGDLPRLELPTDRPRPAVQGFRGAMHVAPLPRSTADGVRALTEEAGATPFMVLLAAFKALLLRYTGQDDVVIGTPIANRNRAEVEGLIGFFVNSLVLRTDLSGDPTFRELVTRVRETTLAAYDRQDLPFERLVEELQPDRVLSRNPLFQVVFAVQNVGIGAIELPGVRLSLFPRAATATRFDLEVHVWESAGEIALQLFYDADLFEPSTIERLASHYALLLEAAAARPDARLSSLPLMDAATQGEVVASSHGPRPSVADTPLPVLVAQRAAQAPEALAVVDAGVQLTFGQLEGRAGSIARRLQELGVGRGEVVAVFAERSADFVVAALAIVKAGAAYLPLDPGHPADRGAFMLADAGVRVVLVQERLAPGLPSTDAQVVGIAEASKGEGAFTPVAVTPDDLAYVIYTSGSTGRPKGVEVEHRGLANLVAWHRRAYTTGPQDRTTLVASPAFDASVWEVWPSLAGGASLHVPDEETRMTPSRLTAWLRAERVTQSFLPTPLAEAVLREESLDGLALQVLLTGGDKLHRTREGLPFRLVNHYGPTENAVVATAGEVLGGAGDPPIGVAIDHTEAYVLDARMELVPAGVPGELYVGGRSLARGYRGRPDWTAERFVPDPFATTPGARLYRTGDVVRRRLDGALEFLGRNDAQVKVRGHRIELGEVEAALLRHPSVRDAVVIAREDEPGQRRLVAYVVPRTDGAVGSEDEASHVTQWKSLYEQTYGQKSGPDDPTFNITGWNSSYTGQPLPGEEMREWVETTCARILARRPRRILEIGCGTGLLLSRLAPHCERYVAVDFSEVALAHIRERILPGRGWSHVELRQGLADDLDALTPGAFDAVILNSVIQYFPSVDYLLRVLRGAALRLAPGGFLFVGDVRSLRLLEAYHASVQRHQAPASIEPARLRQRIAERLASEEELVVDPAFFLALAEQEPALGHVQIQPKWGRFRNELSAYRYDAILQAQGPAGVPAEWIDWSDSGLNGDGLAALVRQEAGRTIALRGVRNARVADETEGLPAPALTPEDVRVLAEATGRVAEVSWARTGSDGRFDAVLRAEDAPPVAFPREAVVGRRWQDLANDPLRARALADLGPELREALERELPEPMVPSAFVVLAALPLSGSGKVDRRALPPPEAVRREGGAGHVAPRSPVEEGIAAVWCEVLGLARVSVHDDFFELGGHSLLATQVTSRVRDTFGVELSLRDLFEAPTVAGLAATLETAATGDVSTPIVPASRAALLPLSFSQERLFFLEQLHPGSGAYAMPFVLKLQGALDPEALERSLAEVARRHEALRTVFVAVDGRPIQRVLTSVAVPLERRDVGDVEAARRDDAAHEIAREFFRRPFDLGHGPLLRAALVALAADEHVLLLAMHHIVSDGWSMGVLVREVSAFYEAFTGGAAPRLPALEVQFADYAVWQRERLQGDVVERQMEYWRATLRDLAPLELPTDRPRPETPSFRGAAHRFVLPKALQQRLRELCRREGATPFMVLLAAVQAVLARTTGQDDVVVGTPIAGRHRREIEGLVGFFVNSLVLRGDLSGDPTFVAVLKGARDVALGAYAHQEVPFERLVDELQPQREMSRNPLYQVSVSLQNAPADALRLGDVVTSPWRLETTTTRFDLELYFLETPGGIATSITYSTDLFDAATIARFAAHLETLLEGALAAPETRLSELPLLTPRELEQAAAWNETAAAFPERCAHELIEAQALATPEAVAVSSAEGSLTYAALDRQATALARRLRGLGIGPEARVAVLLGRRPSTIAALLAVWKAGAAYVPLDARYPRERLAFMLEDSGASLLLTEGALERLVPAGRVPTLLVDGAASEPATGPVTWAAGDPGQLAYVIYTSGSTGRPKGSMVSHRGLVNYLTWAAATYRVGERGSALHSPLAFDLTVTALFVPLVSGRRVDLVPEGELDALAAHLQASGGCSLLKITPAHLKLLAALPPPPGGAWAETYVVGGEALTGEALAVLRERQPTARVINEYGPTETVVGCCVEEVATPLAPGPIAIGRPLANARMYVLDRHLNPLPVGAPGELFIAGTCVERGYLGRPDLTAERFLPDPWSAAADARMYRTGDVGRRLADGRLDYLGRTDEQVKVQGYRIELGEIESVLEEHPQVADAVVVAREDEPGEKRLVAYFVGDADAQELRAHLRSALPDYMVPTALVRLPEIPLSPNGKVERRALPAPDGTRVSSVESVAPRDATEALLVRLWSEVLRVEGVGVHDNFFELGGDSILSLRVVARAAQAGIAMTPVQLFRNQTVAELARVVGASRAIEAEQGPVAGSVPLTPIQAWFFEGDLADRHHYNQALLLEAAAPLEPKALAAALERVAAHHDILRARFARGLSGWKQELPERAPAFPLSVAERGDEDVAVGDAQARLDLEHGPIARAVLLPGDGRRRDRVLLAVHHLAIDWVSWGIVVDDLESAYAQARRGGDVTLPAKTTSYKAWSERLATFARSEDVRSEAEYWTAAARPARAALPPDRPEGDDTAGESTTVLAALSPEETRALHERAVPFFRTEASDLSLTALGLALAARGGAGPIVVDLEGHGREELFADASLARTVGWFTTLYPVRLDLDPARSDAESVRRVRDTLRNVPRRGVGYGLLRYAGEDAATREALRAAPSELVFNYIGRVETTPRPGALLTIAPVSAGAIRSPRQRRRHALEVTVSLVQGCLVASLRYGSARFRRSTMEALAAEMRAVLLRFAGVAPSAGSSQPEAADIEAALSEVEFD